MPSRAEAIGKMLIVACAAVILTFLIEVAPRTLASQQEATLIGAAQVSNCLCASTHRGCAQPLPLGPCLPKTFTYQCVDPAENMTCSVKTPTNKICNTKSNYPCQSEQMWECKDYFWIRVGSATAIVCNGNTEVKQCETLDP